ncbi:MAG TPA: hypothetical protein VIZ61_00225 [Solirubrobacterales bacterium]
MVERLLARVRGHSLDERLLAGERPEESRRLMARSAILLEPRYRSEVAGALREALDAAEHARRIFLKAQVRLREREIIAARSQIRDLADRLEGDPTVDPRGVILADRLIRDGDSPLFWPCNDSVEAAVEQARAALLPD